MRHKNRKRTASAVVFVVALEWLVSCFASGSLSAQESVLGQLRVRFNQDKGVPRLSLLLSPT